MKNSLFDEKWGEFSGKGVAVVGVRNEKGAKGFEGAQKLVIDEVRDVGTGLEGE